MPPHISLALCDLNLWPPDPQSWSFYTLVPWTTCPKLHQYRFTRENTTFTSLFGNRRTNGQTER